MRRGLGPMEGLQGPDQVQGILGTVVEIAGEDPLAPLERPRDRDVLTLLSRVGLCREEGLGQEVLQFPGALERQAVHLRQLFDADDRHDALELLIFVQDLQDLLGNRSEEHTSELQSQSNLVCRLLLEKKKNRTIIRSWN